MKNIFSTLKNKLFGLAGDHCGQTMTEYALVAGFLAAVAVVFLASSGNSVKVSFANMNAKLSDSVADNAAPVADSPAPSDDPSGSADDGGNGDDGDDGDDGGSDGDDGGKDKKDKKPKKPKKSK